MTTPEEIRLPAIRTGSGTIVHGTDHGDCLRKMFMLGYESTGSQQGYTTSHGRFVSSREALPIARAAGQTRSKTPPYDQLNPEDMAL